MNFTNLNIYIGQWSQFMLINNKSIKFLCESPSWHGIYISFTSSVVWMKFHISNIFETHEISGIEGDVELYNNRVDMKNRSRLRWSSSIANDNCLVEILWKNVMVASGWISIGNLGDIIKTVLEIHVKYGIQTYLLKK